MFGGQKIMAVWYVKRSAFLVSLQQTGGPPSWRIHWDVWPSAAEAWKSKWIAPSWELPDPASLRVGLTTPKASFRKAVQILLFFFCVRLAEHGRKHCACDILWRHCADWHFYSLDVFWMGFGIVKDFTPWDPADRSSSQGTSAFSSRTIAWKSSSPETFVWNLKKGVGSTRSQLWAHWLRCLVGSQWGDIEGQHTV